MRGSIVVIVAFLLLSGCPSSCASPASSSRLTFGGEIFASRWRVVVVAPAPGSVAGLETELIGVLKAVEGQLSAWRRDAEVVRCHDVAAGVPCPISADTAEVLAACLDVARSTDGAFDVTVAPVLALWGFSPSTKGRPLGPPSPAEIAAALARVGSDGLSVSPGGTLTRTRDDVQIDATAVTDGAAARALGRALWARGLRHFLVDVAGEVVVAGSADGDGAPWRVGISDPLHHADEAGAESGDGAETGDGAEPSARVALLRGPPTPPTTTTPALLSLSTSGSTRDLREIGGRTVSHIIDPRLGGPVVSELVACTIVGPDAVIADALSTACMVLGPEATATALRRFPGTSALWAFADGRVVVGAGFPAPP